jgi:ribosomal protein L21
LGHREIFTETAFLRLQKTFVPSFSSTLLYQEFFIWHTQLSKQAANNTALNPAVRLMYESSMSNPARPCEIAEVLLVADGGKLQLGAPFVDGAKVKATVLDQFKDDKVIAFKFRRRKGYHRTVGHRRRLTTLENRIRSQLSNFLWPIKKDKAASKTDAIASANASA